MLLRHGPRATVQAGVLCTLCLVAVVVSGSTAARADAAHALVPAVAAPVPGYSDGAIAFSCRGYNGTHGVDGWVSAHPDGTFPRFVRWTPGPYVGGVQWSPDGSQMVHVAAMSPTGVPTVAVSEDFGTYPWQAGSTAMATGATIADPVFTADGTHILFTRTTGGTTRIQQIAAAGSDPPTDMAGLPAGATSAPTVAPDGDVAFVDVPATGPNAGVASIWVVPDGTTSAVKLADGSRPRYSADGSFLAFVAPGGLHLRTMKPDGTAQTTTGPSFTQPIDDFALSPDQTIPEVVVSSGGTVVKASFAPGATTDPWGGGSRSVPTAPPTWPGSRCPR